MQRTAAKSPDLPNAAVFMNVRFSDNATMTVALCPFVAEVSGYGV